MAIQLALPEMENEASVQSAGPTPVLGLRDSSFERNKQSAVHRWVPWIAGFSAGLVADAFQTYLPDPDRHDVTILEPFSGVGTTLVEGLLHGYNVIGFEINPYAALASRVKCTVFQMEPEDLRRHLLIFEHKARQRTTAIDSAFAAGADPTECCPTPKSAPPPAFRSRVPFFSPAVERKALHCLDVINELPIAEVRELFLLAFGAVMVSFSNYSYEPSLGSRVAAGKPEVLNADVVGILTTKMRAVLEDLAIYRAQMALYKPTPTARVVPASGSFGTLVAIEQVVTLASIHSLTKESYLQKLSSDRIARWR